MLGTVVDRTGYGCRRLNENVTDFCRDWKINSLTLKIDLTSSFSLCMIKDPVNSFSVILGRFPVFLGVTSTKQSI